MDTATLLTGASTGMLFELGDELEAAENFVGFAEVRAEIARRLNVAESRCGYPAFPFCDEPSIMEVVGTDGVSTRKACQDPAHMVWAFDVSV